MSNWRVVGSVALAIGAHGIGCSDDPPSGVGGAATSSASGSGATASSSSGAGTGSVGGELPATFTVTGVVTDGERPVEGAIVMQGGAGTPALTTGPDGTFTIEVTQAIPGQPTVVAAKQGYRTRGEELFEVPESPIELELRFVHPPDNPGYVYGPPGVGDPDIDSSTAVCGHCHTTLVAQFQTSAHAKSTRDPLVQDLYAGVSGKYATAAGCQQAGGTWRSGLEPGTASTAVAKCYLGSGVLPDLNPGCGAPGDLACDDPALPAASKPKAFGGCADCHAPAIDGKAGGRSLHEAVGTAFENGNHCDFCHHVRDVDLTKPPGNAGRLVLQRPSEKVSDAPDAPLRQVMFGPLLDVPNEFMGGSLQPKFSTSELCAGCHQQEQEALLPGATLDPARWPDGLPTHSTFQEWSEGPFSDPNTQCQACHMPPDESGLKSTMDVTDETNASITFGFVRPPEQIRQHVFRGPLAGDPRLIDGAVQVFVAPSTTASEVAVAVTLRNGLAGHAIPTGEPMRSVVLLIHAEACGSPMVPIDGMTLNDVGGWAAEGAVGAGVTVAAAVVTWPDGAARAKAGDVVRFVRPTGAFDDYPGVGLFAGGMLTPAEKGLEIRAPVGEATVLSVAGDAITLDAAVPAQAGDLAYLGDALVAPPPDGEASRALAGAVGYTFARVMVDPSGARHVPHHRAVDIASDNRLAPQVENVTTHSFAIPVGCATGQVTATVLYRPIPVVLARERGWDARDYVIASATESVALQ